MVDIPKFLFSTQGIIITSLVSIVIFFMLKKRSEA